MEGTAPDKQISLKKEKVKGFHFQLFSIFSLQAIIHLQDVAKESTASQTSK